MGAQRAVKTNSHMMDSKHKNAHLTGSSHENKDRARQTRRRRQLQQVNTRLGLLFEKMCSVR